MAKVPLLSEFNSFFNLAATRYGAVGTGGSANNGTEAQQQITFRIAGTFSILYAKILTNSRNGTTTIKLRVNGADGTEVVVMGASTSGEIEDNSNTDAVIATDEVAYSVDVAGSSGSLTVHLLGNIFDATTNTAYRFIAGEAVSFSTASTTRYTHLAGRLSGVTTENNMKLNVEQSLSIKNLYLIVETNARTTTTTYRTRKNGANGAQTLSVTSTATGTFEDTTNTDTGVAGNDFNTSFTTSTGTGAIATRIQSVVVETTDSKFCLAAGNTSAGNMAFNTTRYDAVGGKIPQGSTESEQSHESNIDFTASNLGIYVPTNTMNASTSAAFRINSVSTSLALSITASTTGIFEDNVNSASVANGDEINIVRINAGASGGMNISTIRVVGTFVSPSAGQPMIKRRQETPFLGGSLRVPNF